MAGVKRAMEHETTPRNARYTLSELEIVRAAARIMGVPSVSEFQHDATVMLSKAIIEAADSAGIQESSWGDCWIGDATIRHKA